MNLAKLLIVGSILLAGCATQQNNSGQLASEEDQDDAPTGSMFKHHQNGDVRSIDPAAIAAQSRR